MKSKDGITLTELIVVLAVIGVVIGLWVSGADLLRRTRLANAVATIESSVGIARQTAKREDRQVLVELVQDADGTWLVEFDGGRERLVGVRVSSGPVALELEPPYGTYSGPDLEIVVNNGASSKKIVVTGVLARAVTVQ